MSLCLVLVALVVVVGWLHKVGVVGMRGKEVGIVVVVEEVVGEVLLHMVVELGRW